MFVSSTAGEETVKRVIATSYSHQKAEFPHILDQQIADPVQPAHTSVSAERLRMGSKGAVAPDPFFLNNIIVSDHYPPVSNQSVRYPAEEKSSGSIPYPEGDGSQPGLKTPERSELVPIGTLSKNDPTVSELLIKHPAYGKNCWNILSAGINRDKTYTTLPRGSQIYLNPENHEIVWNRREASYNSTQPESNTPKNGEPVFLGTLSKSDPTVSELLIKHPAYGKNCWGILSAGINRDKTYTTLPRGSQIYLNPENHEIVWNGNKAPATNTVQAPPPDLPAKQTQPRESNPFSAGLVKAIKPYLGKPYKEMNCFELVAQGLEGAGIRYYGRNGLGERLVKMATERGLSSNHYLTGEGLIETSGSPVYSKSIQNIRNSKNEARKLYQEVEPFLHKGLILSFSTPTRGHTGIVSQRGTNWTYINSGHMDHRLEGRASKGVGEEFLGAEIRNWFRLAARRKEPLQITVGRLDEHKLRALST